MIRKNKTTEQINLWQGETEENATAHLSHNEVHPGCLQLIIERDGEWEQYLNLDKFQLIEFIQLFERGIARLDEFKKIKEL